MKIIFKKRFKNLFYYALIFLAVILTMFYGQDVCTNIGTFVGFENFGGDFGLALTIVLPILISLLYFYIIGVAKSNNYLKKSLKHTLFLIFLGIMMVYMSTVIIVKDSSYLYLDPINNKGPEVIDKVQSILSFYLSLLMLYTFYYLSRSTKYYKNFLLTILSLIVIYTLITVGYSCFTELDLIKSYFINPHLIFKQLDGCQSFYENPNVFGHTLYIGILSLILISFITKKHSLSLILFIFYPFILFSRCRGTYLSVFVILVIYIHYLLIKLFKKNKALSISIFAICYGIGIYLVLDAYVFHLIQVTYEGVTYNLSYVCDYVGRTFLERFNILTPIFSKFTLSDHLFGVGYGMNYFVSRYNNQYYMHNTFAEIYLVGGVTLSLVFTVIYFISLYKVIKMNKSKDGILCYFILLTLSQIFYGLSESMPYLFPDFFGGFFGFMFVLVINMEYDNFKEREFNIMTLVPFISKKKLEVINKKKDDNSPTFNVLSLDKEVKNESKNELKEDQNIYDIKINYEIYEFDKPKFPHIEETMKTLKEEVIKYCKNKKIHHANVIILVGTKEKVFFNAKEFNPTGYTFINDIILKKVNNTYYLMYSDLVSNDEK